ncbi:hypothetical protein B0T25DRAFT_574346 [Lasiosphaeria hispida]|uniref:Rhodopsin domain-containing protein n=1 Tax=Lasiosphaeria hispida TaxID=260671 RepID=A0AAJ0H7E7_9PEZI|nr:hypothetical protein B0T25DRAFT_574346 [Lasiosphaeria hispida]
MAAISAPPSLLGLPVTDLQIRNSRTYTGVVTVLLFISTSMVATRIVSRGRSRVGLAIDDRFIIAASILGIIDWALILSTLAPVLGPRPEFLRFSQLNQIAPITMASTLASSWSVALLKTSIAFMLLRLQQSRRWVLFLYTIITIQMLTAVFATIMHLTRCIPLPGLWDPTVTAKACWSDAAFKASLTVVSVVIIATDVVFTLVPLTFLRHMRRPVRDRAIIGVLLSLGLFASAASIVKAAVVQSFAQDDDGVGKGMGIALWASIEAQIGITAACIPCLRSAFSRFLGRVGLGSTVRGGPGPTAASWHGEEGLPRVVPTSQSEEDILGDMRIMRKTDIEIELSSRPGT